MIAFICGVGMIICNIIMIIILIINEIKRDKLNN